MPVTAKLSRKFYDKLGEDVAIELVEWFNQVDATYRSELRDLFTVHFDRFDAKLEQRVGELAARLLQVLAEMKGDLRAEIAVSKVETLRWNFVFWAAALGSLVALLKL